MKNKKKGKLANKKTLKRILIILILLLLLLLFFIIRKNVLGSKTQKDVDDLTKQLEEELEKAEERKKQQYTEESYTEELYTDEKESSSRPDLSSIFDLNPDIIGWISVDGTIINYPILQSIDDEFYLTHNYKKEFDSQGAIYIEKINSGDFTDFNTVIYGHSMLNGNMFRAVHFFGKKDFFNEHKEIIIYTREKTLKYHIFESATISSDHIFTYLDLSSPASIKKYADNLVKPLSGALYDGTPVSADDKIITLSTCTINDAKRQVLFAKLVEVIE